MAEIFTIIKWQDEREEAFASDSPYINTPHVASTLIDDAVYENEPSLTAALDRTFQVFMYLQIPIHLHFKRVHIHGISGHVQDDWALSDLAFYLLLMNGDAHHDAVACAQAYAIKKALR